MIKINCAVENCSHNNCGTCYANRINVEGNGAKNAETTCCASFLDKRHYSTLTNNTNSQGACDCLVCGVTNCAYNDNKLCTAEIINVSGAGANIYNETNCETFKQK